MLLGSRSPDLKWRRPFTIIRPKQLCSQQEVYNSIFSSVNKGISKPMGLISTPGATRKGKHNSFRSLHLHRIITPLGNWPARCWPWGTLITEQHWFSSDVHTPSQAFGKQQFWHQAHKSLLKSTYIDEHRSVGRFKFRYEHQVSFK